MQGRQILINCFNDLLAKKSLSVHIDNGFFTVVDNSSLTKDYLSLVEHSKYLGDYFCSLSVKAYQNGCLKEIIPQELTDNPWLIYLHDVGDVRNIDIRRIEGKLTDEQFLKLKVHPQDGLNILTGDTLKGIPIETLFALITSLPPAPKWFYSMVLFHHLTFNQPGGYPIIQKFGKSIPVAARVLTIVDNFDALTTPRKYRKEQSFYPINKALEIMTEETGKMDPEIFEIFKNLVSSNFYKFLHKIN